ncbi:ABC transporter ATP-binding protein [Schaedlerella arabinosiphila]|jgi:ABC-2 type transport system ATP-binding protein|uniref:ABC transporter ATP-binding protein n=1 Tax=Schaedlerella arabinosiphila TaxID=2044587 RepID=A0A426DS17_9FIRM|nr:ABC transporter ATP-binding protein [Schaedlerella arabinosiphila]MCI9144462.1 ABC transporter ATP-binding protein [Lachnospiraceae bacterium]RRK36978.1 ABC transporter ATP-binding protein [Schaedlerella arabinosiphila]
MELKIERLCKQFKDKKAVDDASLTLTPGVWGLLGANGAGKTTLMRMIANVMTPTRGAVCYDGTDIRKMGETYRDIFGFLPQDFGYSRDFTVKDYLEYVAALKGVPARETENKINHLLEVLTLSDVKRKKIAKLSGGMKRRVGIAQAMLNEPKVLVMDEPTAGLDPGERVRFRNFISEFSHDRIVLISTHIVSDIEYIATRNAIMKAGKIVDIGRTDELVRAIEGKVWTCTIPARDLAGYEMRLRIINQRSEDNGQVSIRYLSEKPEISGAVTAQPRLEDLYLWYFPQENTECEGNALREGERN